MAASLVWRLTGGAANADPGASLGGTRSSEELSATAMNNLFDNVKSSEALTGDNEFRALDLYNAGDAAATVVKVWVDPQTSSADSELELGDDAIDSSLAIANESIDPAGISFSAPAEGSPMELPDIAPGEGFRVWFKRIVDAVAANTAEDTATIVWEYA